MSDHYQEQREAEIIIERFKIEEQPPFFDHFLRVTFDEKEISIDELVNIANQLASALNDRGCRFEVKK